MSIETHIDWITGSYITDVRYVLEVAENNALRLDPTLANLGPSLDSVQSVAIGYGYDLLQNAADAASALQAAGATIADPDGLTNLLEGLAAPLTPADVSDIASYISVENTPAAISAFATNLLQNEISAVETELSTFLEQKLGIIDDIPPSNERVALMDLFYNSESYFIKRSGALTNLSNALMSGNRAQAWFEIRYRSAAGGAQGAGLVSRRYVDSQLFGLYTDGLQATETEALQAYQVLTANRALIVGYEQAYGANPYDSGALTPSGYIAAANQSYNLAGTGAEVQTLAEIFEPAAQEQIHYLDGLYSGVLPDIEIDDTGSGGSSGFNLRSIDFFATSATNQIADANNAPGATAADASTNHILLGSETGDELIGGEGSDVLVAQSGNETLHAGAGSDTLIADSGNDTLLLGGSSDVLDFVFPGTSGYTETVIENNAAAVGSIEINGSQIGSGLTSTGLDTWTDENGNTYQFVPNPGSAPPGYSPATCGSDVGELRIVLGGLSGDNEVEVWGFNLSQAESSGPGFLGITLPPSISLSAGATAGVDPPAPDFTAGTTQSYTVWLDAPDTSAQTVTVTLSGAPPSDFGLASGTSVIPINGDGTFSVTIAAGQTSASFSLVNIGDVGAPANLQLIASVSDPADQNDTISSTPLTQNYVEPAQDPFAAGVAQQLYYFGSQSVNGVSVGTYEDSPGSQGNGTLVGAVADGNELIALAGAAGESISGGTGSDTIGGAFIQPANVNGGVGPVSVIDANGGQDIIDIGDSAHNSQDPPVRIYGNSSEDLAQAIADAEQSAPTHQQGDLISTYIDDATIVGGSGDDLIMSSSNGVIVAGPGDDTIVGGGSLSFTGNLTGATWSTDLSGDQLSFGGSAGISLATSAGSYSYSSYEGNADSFGYALGTSNQTIFGGAGNDAVLLSNGNNAVNLGSGDSTVFGGMGNNTISGGSGSDSLVGGGGNDYIEAGTGNDIVAGYGGNNTIFGGSGRDTMYAGAAGSNWATVETGDNYVEAGSGNTLIYGSGGSDTLVGGAGTDTIDAGHGSESIVAGTGDTSIVGGNGPDTIAAGSGSDTILGSTGSTTIYGGSGVDQIAGQGGTDVIYAGDGGTSEAATSVTAGSGSTTIYGGQGVDQIWGGDGADVIYAGDGGTTEAATQVVAGSGDATIYGGDGIDHIFGGSGTDVLYAGDGGDEGNLTYVTAGTGVTTLYGGAGASVLRDDQGGSDVLEAGSGNTALYGVGQDTLIAGSGSDYLVGGPSTTYDFGPNDSLDEVASSGGGTLDFSSSVDPTDLSLSAILDSAGAGSLEIDEGGGSITLDGGLSGESIGSVDFDDPESLSLTQFIQQEASLANVTTSTLAGTNGNFIFDVGAADSLRGGTGQDTISAWGNDDTISAGPGGTDILAGGTDDLVMGGSGNDTLDAASAGTTLVGGMGNEVFDVSDSTDVVDGQAGAASNQIYSTASYTLPTNVDVLTLTGTADLSATGNSDSANLITGNLGNDSLIAGSGRDTLVSGSGVDTLFGGSGPTTFVVKNSADVVEPAAFEGWQDTIESSVNYVLTAAVSTLDLTGSSNLSVTDDYGDASITGNSGNDTLIGGSVRDTLVAGTGADTFEAGSGNNTFVINSADDVIQVDGTEGSDTVESSVNYMLGQGLDTLELTGSSSLEGEGNDDATNLILGNSGSDTLTAGSGGDTLVAGSGSDTLVAGSGTDVLEGRAGATTYLFNAGFGQTEIEPGTGVGTVEFGAGIIPSDLTVGLTADSNGNPALLIQDGNSAVTVDGGLAGSIGAFDFVDGTQLSLAGLLAAATVIPGSLAGDNGNAVLNTSAAASLSGGYGADTILGTGASDTLTAGTGNQYLLGAGDADSITGAFGNDTLVAGGANDTVVAGNGAQVLYALGTGDVLTGGIGDDTLYGGAGADTLVSGTGGTVIYGGNSGDTVVLTQGANVTFHPSGTGGVEFIELPNQMTLADFTSYQGAGGDLILQSLTGDTTAVIKGFYDSNENGKTWLIADSTGAVQPLSNWLDANSQPPSGYQTEIQDLEQAYAASVPGILDQVGAHGGTIANPGTVVSQTPQYIYTFEGATTDNVTVQGGALEVGSSEDDQSTFTNLQTGSTTYTVTVPVDQEVTIPGSASFIPDSALDGLDQSNMQNAVGAAGGGSVEPGTDANGDAGYWVTMLPSTEYVQTSSQTIVETVPTYTAYQQETQGFTAYNITGDGGNDAITAHAPFVGTVVTGNGNVSLDLGMEEYFYDSPNQPPLGAFIEAGNGNDTLLGSGGTDTIAAGTGYDYIQAGFGSTVYVPLEGASTEEIDVLPPLYGSGPLPHSTLVLPNGVTPEDLQYRLISSWAYRSEQFRRDC